MSLEGGSQQKYGICFYIETAHHWTYEGAVDHICYCSAALTVDTLTKL